MWLLTSCLIIMRYWQPTLHWVQTWLGHNLKCLFIQQLLDPIDTIYIKWDTFLEKLFSTCVGTFSKMNLYDIVYKISFKGLGSHIRKTCCRYMIVSKWSTDQGTSITPPLIFISISCSFAGTQWPADLHFWGWCPLPLWKILEETGTKGLYGEVESILGDSHVEPMPLNRMIDATDDIRSTSSQLRWSAVITFDYLAS